MKRIPHHMAFYLENTSTSRSQCQMESSAWNEDKKNNSEKWMRKRAYSVVFYVLF